MVAILGMCIDCLEMNRKSGVGSIVAASISGLLGRDSKVASDLLSINLITSSEFSFALAYPVVWPEHSTSKRCR
jgi:hypothetical protein